MRINVNIERSLESGRVEISDVTTARIVDALIYGTLAGAMWLATFCLVLAALKIAVTGGVSILGTIITMIPFFLLVIVSFSFFQENRLSKARGASLNVNRQAMIKVLKDRYQTNLIYKGDRMLTYYRRSTFWKFGVRIVVLLDEHDVFINISRFNQYDLKSFFHGFSSYLQERSILREFHGSIGSVR
jgi:hypothetical protein